MNSNNQDSPLGRNAKMKSHDSTSSGEPATKKRKTPATTTEDQNELEKMKAEMVKMKQLIKEQQKTICSQAMTITRLQGEKENCNATDEEDSVTEIRVDDDRPAQSNMVEMVQINDDESEKNKFEKELIELKSKMDRDSLHLQQQNEAKDENIGQLESMVSTIKNIKTDPEQVQNCLQATDDTGKKLKDLEARLAFMTNTENSLRTTVVQLEDDRNQLTKLLYQTDSGHLKTMLIERNKKIAEMKKLLELKEEDLKDLQSRITELDSIYKDIEQQKVDAKNAEYNKLIVEHEKAMKMVKSEMQSKVENERQKCKAESDATKVTVAELNKKLSTREALLIQYGNQFKELKTAEFEIENERQNYKAEIDKLKVTLNDLTKKLSNEQALVIQYENEVSELKTAESTTETDKLRDTVLDLNKKLSDNEAVITQYVTEINETKTAMHSGLQNEREKYEAKIRILNGTVDHLNKKISNEFARAVQFMKDIDEMKTSMQVEAENERKKCKVVTEKLEATVDEFTKKISDYQKTIDQQLVKNEKLKEKITEFETNESKLRLKVEELEQNEHESNETIADQQRKIQDLENGLTKNEGDLKKDGLRFISLDEIFNDLNAANNCLTSSSNDIILKVSRILSKNGDVEVFSIDGKQLIDFKLLNFFTNTSYQFQIDGELELSTELFYILMPRIYSCNLTKLNLEGAVIPYEIFIKLVSSHTILSFKDVKVKYENGKRVAYDEILKELLNIKIFEMEESDGVVICELCKNLSKLPPLPKLQKFKLSPVDPSFDLVTFGDFVKKYPEAAFHLQYSSLSEFQETLLSNLPSNCKVFTSD